MPRNLSCSACRLILTHDEVSTDYRGMYWENTDGNTEWWGTDITAENEGLLLYNFELDTPWGTLLLGKGKSFDGVIGSANKWQLTVYSAEFTTPEWLKGGIIYQIFPDRFRNSGKVKSNVPTDRILRDDWGGTPIWEKDSYGEILNNDYFGGDFLGIEQALPYLASLGVNCIYLNPIAEAHSNHRYDVADYLKTDPLLGSIEDFKSLCSHAANYGIRIMTDGVYSHTGSDSVYFNKNRRYGNGGAYNDKYSPFYSWYRFNKAAKYGYDCWWNIPTLPEVDENNLSFTEYITGEGGVIEFWLKQGASALRLDVADELPDEFLENIRKRLKSVNPDAFVLGEVWEDASNKISYGNRRRYLTGHQLDSVMNYPFRDSIISFLKSGFAESFTESILKICDNYPKPALNCMMNHLGTHDTERILTVLAGINCDGMSRAQQANVKLSDEQLKKGIALMKMAYTILYTLPGIPSIYYGDEILLTGCRDPFNRGCFDWNMISSDFVSFIRTLGEIRKKFSCLKKGDFIPVSSALGCVAYLRDDGNSASLLTIANNNSHAITYYLNERIFGFKPLIGGIETDCGVYIEGNSCAILCHQTNI